MLDDCDGKCDSRQAGRHGTKQRLRAYITRNSLGFFQLQSLPIDTLPPTKPSKPSQNSSINGAAANIQIHEPMGAFLIQTNTDSLRIRNLMQGQEELYVPSLREERGEKERESI